MADFDAFDRMSRTLRGASATLPPRSPTASMAESLRNPPSPAPQPVTPAAPLKTPGFQPVASDIETRRGLSQQAAQVYQQKVGGVNAGSATTQVPNRPAPLAGQQMGASNPGSVGSGGTGRLAGAKTALTSVADRAKTAVSSAVGKGNPSVGAAFKSAGSAASGVASGAGKLLRSPGVAAGFGIAGAVDGIQTDTEQYAKRFGLENTQPGLLRDVGVRSLGVASDVGNAMLFGAPKALGLFRDTAEADQPAVPPAAGLARVDVSRALRDEAANPYRVEGANYAKTRQAGNEKYGENRTSVNPELPGIYKTVGADGRVSFTNIGADGQPTAASQQQTPYNSMPAGSFGMSAMQGNALANARQAALARGDVGAVDASFGGGGSALRNGAGGPSGTLMGIGSDEARQIMRDTLKRQPNEPSYNYNARVNAAEKMLGLDVDERGNIRNNETSSANNAETNATTRRGQDMDLAEKLAAQKATANKTAGERELMAMIDEKSGGDMRTAAALAMKEGRPDIADTMLKIDGTVQDRDDKNRKNAIDSFSNFYTGAEGLDENRKALVQSQIEKMAPGYFSLGSQEQLAMRPQIEAQLRVLQGMNETKDAGILKAVGWDKSSPALDALPDLRGAAAEDVGFWEGAFTPGIERGDAQVRLRDGTERYIPRGNVTQDVEALLRQKAPQR